MPLTEERLSPEIRAHIAAKFPMPKKPMHNCKYCGRRCLKDFPFCLGCNKVLSTDFRLFQRYHDARRSVQGMGHSVDAESRVAAYEAVQAECLEYLKGAKTP